MTSDDAGTSPPEAKKRPRRHRFTFRKHLRSAGYGLRRRLIWPDADRSGPGTKRRTTAHLDVALRECPEYRSAIQAGGHCGVWALALADRFATVYTFEPDPDNFTALSLNTAEKRNIVRFQAALGAAHGTIGLARKEGRTGRTFVRGEGIIPMLKIDDLGLRDCDLIVLDVEGGEMNALRGGRDTLKRCRPVLMFEDKGHSRRFGSEQGALLEWLEMEHSYQVVERVNHDVVMTYMRPDLRTRVLRALSRTQARIAGLSARSSGSAGAEQRPAA